jgi:hypothetical protein
MIQRTNRSSHGTTIAELGPALILGFVVVVFPMMALGTVAMRYGLLTNAANMAAQAACKQRTFLADTNTNLANGPLQLSAVHTAQNVAALACKGIGGGVNKSPGITLTATNVYIKINPMGTQTTATQPAANTPLSSPANGAAYSYNCEVVLTGTIQPLLSGWKGMMGSIPLLNAPYVTNAKADYVFESTNNLNM